MGLEYEPSSEPLSKSSNPSTAVERTWRMSKSTVRKGERKAAAKAIALTMVPQPLNWCRLEVLVQSLSRV